MDYLEYITQDKDRWDLIAWEMYGNPYKYGLIIEHNPQYRRFQKFPPGIKLLIPVIDEEPQEVKAPWHTE